jgi:hypothetical protein
MSRYMIVDADQEHTQADGKDSEVVFMDHKRKVKAFVNDNGNGVQVTMMSAPGKPPGKSITLDYSQLVYLVEAFFIMKSEGNNIHSSTIVKIQPDFIKEI